MVQKNQGLAAALGMPNKNVTAQVLERGRADDVPANNAEGTNPILVSEGEFIFSVPAIMGIGDGDYKRGLELLTQVHEEMKAKGKELIEGQGLGGML